MLGYKFNIERKLIVISVLMNKDVCRLNGIVSTNRYFLFLNIWQFNHVNSKKNVLLLKLSIYILRLEFTIFRMEIHD